jgi:hypothetical protein
MADPTFIIGRRDGLFLQWVSSPGGMRLAWTSDRDQATTMTRDTAKVMDGVLYPVLARDEGWKVEGWPVVCTSPSARWCPVCGDCACRPQCRDCRVRMVHDDQAKGWTCLECDAAVSDANVEIPHDDPECPLHKADSQHAAGQP